MTLLGRSGLPLAVVFQICTFTWKYAMVVPPLRGDTHGTRTRDVPLWLQRSGHQRRPNRDRQTTLSLPTDHLFSPCLRAGARLQRSLTTGQRTNYRYGSQRQWHPGYGPRVEDQPKPGDERTEKKASSLSNVNHRLLA